MRDQEYYDFEGSEHNTDINEEHDYIDDSDPHNQGNEMARNAVERFLEAETSDYIAGYESRKKGRIDKGQGVSINPDDYPPAGYTDDAWRPASPPSFEEDEEYMAKLANVRRDRPRRRESNPIKPAVRVNAERRRRVPEPAARSEVRTEAEVDWVSPGEEDYNTFRPRPAGPDIMSPPREASIKEPRPRGTVPVHRREPENTDDGEGPSPLRYLLAIVIVAVLGLTAFLAYDNRNLRRDVIVLEAQATEVDMNAINLASANVEIAGYRTTLAEYRAENANLRGQLESIGGYEPPADEPDTQDVSPVAGEPPSRPSDDTPPVEEPPAQPPAAEPTIHVVQPGQVLSRIANIHFGSSAQVYVDLIVAANDSISNPNDIQIGQEIIIPPRE
ncbi:MAG: LysM domain-containing protein [Defluviitaleaceae bacterium]|nr:LysM domain-containing protein [Defluviitaleaceae bacterium]